MHLVQGKGYLKIEGMFIRTVSCDGHIIRNCKLVNITLTHF